MLELVKGLDSGDSYQQYLILLSKRIDYPDVYKTHARIIIVDYPSKLRTVLELYKVLKEIRPSILHVWIEPHYVLCLVSFLKHVLRYKLVMGFLADANPVRQLFTRFAYKYAYHMADKIVSNSRAGILAKKAPVRKAEVIYNGFSFSRFSQVSRYDHDTIKKELGVEDKHVVSMFARFSPAKDWDTFLNIAALVGSKSPDVAFLAVGQGDSLEHYREEAGRRRINNVKFLGFRKDIDRILFVSDICVLCTNEKVHAEGVSNSIMEAMAAAKPVIATKGGGTQEIITDGTDGYIIPPCQAEAAAAIILDLLADENKAKQIGDAAKETIVERFSLDDMVGRYKKLYKDILPD